MMGLLINDDDDDETQKEESPPNLLLHNWVVEGRCVSCSTTDLDALVNQTRLLWSGRALVYQMVQVLYSGVPDGSPGLAQPISALPLHYTPLDVKPPDAQMLK